MKYNDLMCGKKLKFTKNEKERYDYLYSKFESGVLNNELTLTNDEFDEYRKLQCKKDSIDSQRLCKCKDCVFFVEDDSVTDASYCRKKMDDSNKNNFVDFGNMPFMEDSFLPKEEYRINYKQSHTNRYCDKFVNKQRI